MSMLQRFAQLLGIGDHQAEDALQSERAARVAVGRRDFLAAGAALATGAVFAQVGGLFEPRGVQVFDFEGIEIQIGRPGLATFSYSFDSGRSFSAPQAIPEGPAVIPGTGLTLTFAKGDYRPGERYTQPLALPPGLRLKRGRRV